MGSIFNFRYKAIVAIFAAVIGLELLSHRGNWICSDDKDVCLIGLYKRLTDLPKKQLLSLNESKRTASLLMQIPMDSTRAKYLAQYNPQLTIRAQKCYLSNPLNHKEFE